MQHKIKNRLQGNQGVKCKLPYQHNTEVTMKSYKHFTLSERECLAENLKKGKTISEIAKILGRHKSSVSREIKRNHNCFNCYNAVGASRKYFARRKNSRRNYKLAQDSELRQYIVEGLSNYWSPETIVAKWKEKNNKEKICHSTIYRALKKELLPEVSIQKNLRRRGKKPGNRKKYATIQPEHTIHEWDESIIKRLNVGDWEGDLICGGIGKGCLLTLVDRKTRFLISLRMEKRDAQTVSDTIKRALKNMPVNSITLDNGPEFADFKNFEKYLKTTTYFADPHSPWQRGSNENINDCLRFFFPKGCDFLKVTDDEVQRAVDIINNRPRKCLHWFTPFYLFSNWCCT